MKATSLRRLDRPGAHAGLSSEFMHVRQVPKSHELAHMLSRISALIFSRANLQMNMIYKPAKSGLTQP